MPALILLLLAVLSYSSCTHLPEKIEQISGVEIEDSRDYTVFYPEDEQYDSTGVLYFPKDLIDPIAYRTILSKLALDNQKIVLFKRNGNLAIPSENRINNLMTLHPELKQWVFIGHGSGGNIAAQLLEKDSSLACGLILCASKLNAPALSNSVLNVLCLLASEDEDLAAIQNDLQYLPTTLYIDSLPQLSPIMDSTTYVKVIQGGISAYFANYQAPKEEDLALISRAAQQDTICNFIRAYFVENQWK